MTKDEIKQAVTMPDLLRRYGIDVRRNMCSCPFHGRDKHPSMQVFKDGYKCHTCGEYGDIFGFVMKMDGVSFKDAYISLGGTYEKHQDDRQRTLSRMRIESERSRKAVEAEEYKTGGKVFRWLTWSIDRCKEVEAAEEPFSDRWCWAVNRRIYLEYLYDKTFIEKEGDGKAGIYIHQQYQRVKEGLIQGA